MEQLPAVSCLTRIQQILAQARHQALQTVNAAMLAAYWHVGREIVEEEQRGQDRAGYGDRLIRELSARLTAEFGRGFSFSNLNLIRQFYLTYRDRSPRIVYTVSSQFGQERCRRPLHAQPERAPDLRLALSTAPPHRGRACQGAAARARDSRTACPAGPTT